MKVEKEYENLFKERAKSLVSQMTLEEKVSLCSGEDCWNTKAIERLGLDSIMMSDGPHGLRKQIGATDNLGIGDSVPAVCFPTASAIACSFDRDLIYHVGKAIGEECVAEGVSIILGPGVNQKRSPLCGRNFEYFSEDAMLSGELAASMIKGIQSTGTGASLKHFAVNNQEKHRMTIDAVIDERTLRETYLKAFEIAVKKGKPDTVMCSYNRLNHEYCSENSHALIDILRNEWGFEGAVLSDWGAVHDRVLGVKNGLTIEMPGNEGYNDAKIIAAVKNKTLLEDTLDSAACQATELILKSMSKKEKSNQYNKENHHQLAIKAMEESAVLLKNEGGLLPGNLEQKVAVVGTFAKQPRYQGAGSSKIHPIKVDTPWDMFMELGADAVYAPGYRLDIKNVKRVLGKREKEEAEYLIQKACAVVKDKDMVYLFAGLPEGYESEGFDRMDMKLPWEQDCLIEAVSACNPNVVVILIGGAPMELPWIHKVKAVLLTYLGGEGVGRAITNLLLGYKVPSGKLAETWPLSLEDTPCYHYFPGGRLTVEYRESIYVGYRYYEKADKPVLFPFGHGLSYVKFIYSNLELNADTCVRGERITITFTVTNSGNQEAFETAFIFVGHENNTVFLPKKELREFVKIHLDSGETKQISVLLDTGDFGYYNTIIKDWYSESGSYQIMVCSSSKNCVLHATLNMDSEAKPQPDFTTSAPAYYQLSNKEFKIDNCEFEKLYGGNLPICDARASRPYTSENTLEDIRHTLLGKIIIVYANQIAKKVTEVEEEQEGMMAAMIKEMPFFSMVASGDGMLSESMMEGILDLLNGHYISGIKKMFQ
ncbi:MAG: glycoside hydrolase family 3 C-terminal domain-containing protein [Velocimicrobium sp.]